MFSKRTDWHIELNPLSELFLRLKQKGETVLDLTESNPTRCNFSYLRSNLLEMLSDEKSLRYEPDPKGLPETRKSICDYYADKGIPISPEQIFLTPSTSDAYHYLFRLLADEGDVIFSPNISYPLFDYLAGLTDVSLSKYQLEYKGKWQYGFKDIEESLNAKAVLIVNPNNPTGNFINQSEKNEVNKIAKRLKLALIVDEVFLDYSNDIKNEPESFAKNEEVLTFTLSGISKVLGLPQMKLSWIIVSGPEEEKRMAIQRLEVIADTFLSVNAVSQHALPKWFKKRNEIQREIKARILSNRNFLEKKLGKEKILKSDGGWYSIVKLQSGLKGDKTAFELLQTKKVYVHPGYFFDFEADDVVVLSLLPEEKVFEEAIGKIVKANI